MAKMRIKKGDTVQVISGRAEERRDRGKQGKVIAVYPEHRAGARRGRQPDQEAHQGRHRPPAARKTGGIVTQEAPIHVCNVQLVDPETKKPHPGRHPRRDRRARRRARKHGARPRRQALR